MPGAARCGGRARRGHGAGAGEMRRSMSRVAHDVRYRQAGYDFVAGIDADTILAAVLAVVAVIVILRTLYFALRRYGGNGEPMRDG